MTVQDFLITPMYFIVLLFGAYVIRPFVTNKYTRGYFIPGLLVKFLGAIAIGFVYQFYYDWGDTYTYFREARIIWYIFLNSPENALRIIFQSPDNLVDLFYLTNQIWTFRAPNNFAMVRILSIINFFTINTYSACALIFAAFSFSGSWAFYSILYKKYNIQHWSLATSILFLPSVVIWGSGIFKDTLTFGALMWLTWFFFNFIEFKKISISSILIGVLSLWMIASIKSYILICYLPLVIIWFVFNRIKNIQSTVLKYLSIPFLLTIGIVAGYFAMNEVASLDAKYELDNIAQTTMITAYDIAYYSGAGGSTYTLGDLDGSWGSMVSLLPSAINVSIFRPYLWEVSNPLMLLSAIESLIYLVLTLWIILKLRLNLIKSLKQPFIIFCLGFALVFAFAVGVSTFNFGTLVRYKIPLMPFYALTLVLLSRIHDKK